MQTTATGRIFSVYFKILEFVNEILKCDHLNESYSVEFTVVFAFQFFSI